MNNNVKFYISLIRNDLIKEYLLKGQNGEIDMLLSFTDLNLLFRMGVIKSTMVTSNNKNRNALLFTEKFEQYFINEW